MYIIYEIPNVQFGNHNEYLKILLQVYGTDRLANVAAPQPLIIYDMPQMTKFVYDFYANKVAAMTEISKPPEINKIEDNQVEGKGPTHKVGQHPGDDRGDSDDEKSAYPEIVNEVNQQLQQTVIEFRLK